jgi:hypothetical protein
MLFPASSTNLVVVFPPPEIGEERTIPPRPPPEKGESIVALCPPPEMGDKTTIAPRPPPEKGESIVAPHPLPEIGEEKRTIAPCPPPEMGEEESIVAPRQKGEEFLLSPRPHHDCLLICSFFNSTFPPQMS